MSQLKQDKLIRWTEPIILGCMWLLVLLSPVLFFRVNGYLQWNKVVEAWVLLIPFAVLFIVNHFVLVPYLLFRNRRLIYIISVVILVALPTFFTLLQQGKHPNQNPPPPRLEEHLHYPDSKENPFIAEKGERPEPPPQPRGGRFPPFLNILLVSLLMIGFDTGLRVSVKWFQLGKEKSDLEKENAENELAFLKNQISPHFFMNTLNNIHALVDIDTEQAKDAIIRLSKLMRQLLYESESDKIPLRKEIDFLQSYINLMSLRFTDNVTITTKFPENVPDKEVPPFLFVSLIENAFKHGVSYNEPSFVTTDFSINEDSIVLTIRNSKHAQTKVDEYSGIGVENTRKRLDLLFGKQYSFAITEKDDVFDINLTIPV